MRRLLLALLLFATPASAGVDSVARGLAVKALSNTNTLGGAVSISATAITILHGGASTQQLIFTPNSGTTMGLGSANSGSGLIVFNNGVQAFDFQGPNFAGVSTASFGFTNNNSIATTTIDTKITRGGVATLHHGAADAASPVAQTVGVQSVVAGTSNTAGVSWTMTGSQGTGTGVGGDIIFQVAKAGSTGTAQNALTEAFRFAAATALPMWPSSTTGAGTSTFTNSPCSGLTTEQWVPIQITGQTGTWYMPACQ